MDMLTSREVRISSFRYPKRYFADVDANLAAMMAASGVDVALIIDKGVIKDVALGNPDLIQAGCEEAWRGTPWRDTVTVDSLGKMDDLLEAQANDLGRWRQVTQVAKHGVEIPIKYTTMSTGRPGRILALGQDLRSIATLQQRLVAMHQDLEREYVNLRDVDTRHRNLFNALSESVIIVAVADGCVSEMNPAAMQRLGVGEADPTGVPFLNYIAPSDRSATQSMIDRALSNGKGEAKNVEFNARGSGTLRATAFRQESDVYAIVRIDPDGMAPSANAEQTNRPSLQNVMDHLPDGLVITTSGLRLLSANPTFLRMIQVVDERQVVGEDLTTWLGRSPAEINILESNLRRHGVVRNFATVVINANGDEEEVELSGVSAELDSETVFGFSIRPIVRRLSKSKPTDGWIAAQPNDVASLVGQMPLKDIVRASTDLIEKLCIETALELSDQSRASAADILGVSRQGLYSKLKRFKIPQND